MTTDGDSRTRIVLSWLHEDAHENAERALLRALDEVDTTPQRRSWWPARRFTAMNAYAKLAIAAAAVLVVAVVGYQFLPSNSGTGGLPTPAPSPSKVAPSPSSTPVQPSPSLTPAIPEGSIAAGTYIVNRDFGITIDVPAGWEGCCEGAILNGEAGSAFAAIAADDLTNVIVYGDSCHWSSSANAEPRGAKAIAAALAAQPGRQGTEPRDITVGGLAGFHVRLTVPADLETTEQPDGDATFVDCDEGEYRTYSTPEGVLRYQQDLSQIDDLYIVDIGSSTLGFDLTYFEEINASDRDALDGMLESIRID